MTVESDTPLSDLWIERDRIAMDSGLADLCRRLERDRAALMEALQAVKITLKVEHALHGDYGWQSFVADTIDPALTKAQEPI